MSHQVEITSLNHSGEGIGRKQDGKIVFVPYTLPGERALIEIVKEKKNWARGNLKKLLSISPRRREPSCEIFYQCGGCHLQHLHYEEQANFKEQMVQEVFARIGGLKNIKVSPLLKASHELYYRNKITLHWKNVKGNEQLGFYSPRSRLVVDTDHCLLAAPLINNTLKYLSPLIKDFKFPLTKRTKQVVIKQSLNQKEVMVIFTAPAAYKESLKQLSHELQQNLPFITSLWHQVIPSKNAKEDKSSPRFLLLSGKEKLQEKILNRNFNLSPASFMQVNISQAEELYKKMLQYFQVNSPLSFVIDLYCGVGTTALLLAETAQKVIGIDSFEPGIEDAVENAKINDILHTSFLSGEAEKHLPHILRTEAVPEAVLLNPPRQGCSPGLLQELCSSKIPFITYISCNPVTLSRDEKFLLEHGYRPGAVQPVDMFPQTVHVECVTTLKN